MLFRTTRRSDLFRRSPLLSLFRLAESRLKIQKMAQIELLDGVILHAESGHRNRCYAWMGERSVGVAALMRILLSPGDTFIDVGSFAGQHAMRAVR